MCAKILLLSACFIFWAIVLFKLFGTCSSGNSVTVKEQYLLRRFVYSAIASFKYCSFTFPNTNDIDM